MYEAKHSAKEGNQAFKKPAPRKQTAPKAKKTEPVDENFPVPAPSSPVAHEDTKPATTKPATNSTILLYFLLLVYYSFCLVIVWQG